jgi:hypothetical protein
MQLHLLEWRTSYQKIIHQQLNSQLENMKKRQMVNMIHI